MIFDNLKKRFLTSSILLIITIFIFINNYFLVFLLLLLGMISILEFSNITKKIFKNKTYYGLINIIFVIYIFFFCVLFFIFSNALLLKIILISILLGCIASDIGGFIFGKIIGGPKLNKISPNKTISGSIGSLLFTILSISYLIHYFTNIYNYKIILIASITSITCQLGDLFFSYLKRKAKLKDTGNFLPGHGGVLDRIDGILVGTPFGIISLLLFFQ